MFNQYPYQMFNPVMMEEYFRQQQTAYMQQLHHQEQRANILKMTNALRDYFEAARKVSPDYRSTAIDACMGVIVEQATKDGISR